MAETYDETTELANAREELLNNGTAAHENHLTTAGGWGSGSATNIGGWNSINTPDSLSNVGHVFSTGAATEDDDAPQLLAPIAPSTLATVPADDDLLEDATQASDYSEEGGEAPTNVATADEPEGVDGDVSDDDTSPYAAISALPRDNDREHTRRRTESAHHITFDDAASANEGDPISAITGAMIDGLMTATNRNGADHQDVNGTDAAPAPIESSAPRFLHDELDLSMVFPVARIKKLFRAGWGDGAETRPGEDADDEGRAVSTTMSASTGFSSAMTSSSTCPMVSADAVAMITHAAALMLDDLVKRSADQTIKRGKKTVTYDDLSLVVGTLDRLAFLEDVVPSDIARVSFTTPTHVNGRAPAASPKAGATSNKHARPKTAKPAGNLAASETPAAPSGLDIASFFKKK